MAEQHGDVSFEPCDVRVGPVFGSLAILAAALAASMLGLWWMQALFLRTTIEQPPALPPEPRIEGVSLEYSVTHADLPTSARSQRLREDQLLRDGWTDAAGKKHPPIAEAMKRLVEMEGRR